MTIQFAAAAVRRAPVHLSPIQARAAVREPANDNCTRSAIAHAAVRQFARHGIGAAEHARQQAERAFFKGDRDTYYWWLAICHSLDQKIIREAVHSAGH